MSELETTLSPSSGSEDRSVQDQLSALHKIIQLSLIALLVIGGCFTVFLWRQQRELSRQVVQWRPFVERYDKFLVPMVNQLVPGLTNYARTHSDLNELLYKYNMIPPPPAKAAIGNVPPPGAAVVPQRTAPTAPSPQKK